MSDCSPSVRRSSRLFDAAWFLFWAILSSCWCVTAASQLGATFDEPIYVQRGLERWHTGSTSGLMKLGTMPLPVDVETLPLYLWEIARGVRLDPVNHLDQLVAVGQSLARSYFGGCYCSTHGERRVRWADPGLGG